MGTTCVSARISVGSNNTIKVTGCDTRATASVRVGELSWKELIIEPDEPTNVITHEKLKRPIKSMCVIDGTPMNWAKVGGERTYTLDDDGKKISGTITFPFQINDQIIFEYK